jgi:hypothetical protein
METKYRIIVDATQKDGRVHLNIQQPSEGFSGILTIEQIRPILAGALAMSIRASNNEAAAMKETMDYLNHEFVDTDSFSDLELRKFNNE